MTRSLKKSFSIMASCRGALLGVAVLSGLINLLYLSGSIFMMEVYDRVLPSRSIPTLVGLSVIIVVLYLFQGLFDMLRGRILARVGAALDEDLSQQIFHGQLSAPLMGRAEGDGQQPLRDLDQIRAFLAGGGPSALFDLPWMPLYLFICFAFHPWIGVVALGGALPSRGDHVADRGPDPRARRKRPSAQHSSRNGISEGARRNAEVVHAMGMAQRIGTRWGDANARYLAHPAARPRTWRAASAPCRRCCACCCNRPCSRVGAYLVIDGQATGGIMIASSILTSRALAPVELAIGNWKGFVGARQGWRRLKTLLEANARRRRIRCSCRRRAPSLSVESAGVGAPGAQKFVVQDVSFELKAGSGARRHRPERLRQVVARPHARRRVADLARQGAARRRGDRAMAAGGSRAAHRLSAAGRRAVRRHRGAEHRALRAAAEAARRSSRPPRRPTCTR